MISLKQSSQPNDKPLLTSSLSSRGLFSIKKITPPVQSQRYSVEHTIALILLGLTQMTLAETEVDATPVSAMSMGSELVSVDPIYSASNSVSTRFYMHDFNVYCTVTLLKQLLRDNGVVIDFAYLRSRFLLNMDRTDKTCDGRRCYYYRSCGVDTLWDTPEFLQSGYALEYQPLLYSGLYVGKDRPYSIGLINCTDSAERNRNCIENRFHSAVESMLDQGGFTLAVIATYVAIILVLAGAGAWAIRKIVVRQREMHQEKQDKATEMSRLLPAPSASRAPVQAEADNDFIAKLPEVGDAEESSNCLRRLCK